MKEVLAFIIAPTESAHVWEDGCRNYVIVVLKAWVTETFSIEQIKSLNKSELVKSIIDKYEIKRAVVIGDRLSDINAIMT